MSYPPIAKGLKISISVMRDGITLYGNKKAFKTLIDWFTWIASSDEKDHYECHVKWHLGSDDTNNVEINFEEDIKNIFVNKITNNAFDLTFMLVEDSDLNKRE